MPYVITSPCIDVKDGACTLACPVECIYQGGRMFYIQPEECIDCGLCESICPVDAIYPDDDVPHPELAFVAVNAEFFGQSVTGWGQPGGAGDEWITGMDHPLVVDHAPRRYSARTADGG